jgi:DNA polymerase
MKSSTAWRDSLADAREQLRRYLEQRREMGESELVLDTLSVDDVLRLIGGRSQSSSSDAAVTGSRGSEGRVPQRANDESGVGASTADSGTSGEHLDWREALRASGASPEEMTKKKIGRYEFPAGDPSADSSGKPAEHSVRENAAPFDASASTAASSADAQRAPAFKSPFADVRAGLSVGGETAELLGGSMASLDTLDAIAAHVASCRRCPLYSTAINPVPGEGNPNADLMCVGEAPGANEDETGRPFIGAAGQLLTKILEAIKLSRDQVYICNVLKHRPPGNRNPLPEEVSACSPYLLRQIELVKPKVILALGTFAAQTLLNTPLSLGKLRGQIHRYHGVPLIVTYHPAALLRNPNWKRPTWEDVQLARRILDSASPGA